MRICIVAEYASYKSGGEAILPLHYFAGLRARNIDAWLVVHTRARQELESAFPNDIDRIHFIADSWFHKQLFRLSRFLPRRLSEATLGLLIQLTTQRRARKIVRQLIAEEHVDVVHQPIPVSPRFPSLMTDLGAPIVIGPMNGGMNYPPAFRHAESRFSRAAIALGRQLSDIGNSLLPGKKRADILLVANERTRVALPSGIQGCIIQLPENGVHLETWAPSGSEAISSGRPRFVFIGRLIDWKAVNLVLEALQRVPEADLTIIGDGPMRAAWKQLADSLGLSERVSFTGWLSQSECARYLQSAQALVLPSIYECGGAVVLEAMAAKVPVIATRWGGPADYLDESSGFLIDPSSRKAIVEGFAHAMQQLIREPALRATLGAHGKEQVQQYFDWEKKIDYILDIYQRLASKKNTESYRKCPPEAGETSNSIHNAREKRVVVPGRVHL